MDDRDAEDVEIAARLICDSGPISVFTGAGISVGSGIPDFRSPGGLWSRHVLFFVLALKQIVRWNTTDHIEILFILADMIHLCTAIMMFSRTVLNYSGAWRERL
jgi:hypothetical protein